MNLRPSHPRIALLLVLGFGFLGCAPRLSIESSSPPPPPCRAGVNATVCAMGVSNSSTWSEAFTLMEIDPRSGQRWVGHDRRVRMAYEFAAGSPQPRWRRTITVDSDRGRRGMFQEGFVTAMTADEITLEANRSSCDDIFFSFAMPKSSRAFYQRVGDTLRIGQTPFVGTDTQDWGEDSLVAGFERGLDSLYFTLIDTFTLGSPRRIMTSGHGTMRARVGAAARALEGVDWGCFSSIGSGFSASKLGLGW